MFRKLFFLFFVSSAQSLGAGPPALNLDSVLSQVAQQNPEFRAAQADAAMAQAESGQAWALPAPQVGVEFWDLPRPGFDLSQAGQRWLDISQDFPSPAKLYYQAQVSSHASMRAQAHASTVLQEQLRMAKEAYWDLYEASENFQALSQSSQVLEGMARRMEHRVEFGRGERMDELMLPMARMQAADFENQALEFQRQASESRAALARLMGLEDARDLGAAQGPPRELPRGWDREKFIREVAAEEPELVEARHHLSHTLAQHGLAESGWLPDLMLQYSLVSGPDSMSSGMAMAKLDLPYLYFWRQKSEVDAAQAEVDHSQAMFTAARSKARQDSLAAWDAYSSSLLELRRQREEILPQALKALKLAQSGFAEGSLGPAESLEAVKGYWMAASTVKLLEAQFGKDLARMEALAGRGLVASEGNHESR
jgi:outer membrane protein TolC